jgi:hypothetical protein
MWCPRRLLFFTLVWAYVCRSPCVFLAMERCSGRLNPWSVPELALSLWRRRSDA